MLTSGYFAEQWDLMDRGTTPDGLDMCHVRRVKRDTTLRSTVWRLVKRANGWYNVGTMSGSLPLAGFRPAPEKNGKKLSNSRIDLTLLDFAQQGYSAR